jgi:CBS domain containing-hemolysin-like protein
VRFGDTDVPWQATLERYRSRTTPPPKFLKSPCIDRGLIPSRPSIISPSMNTALPLLAILARDSPGAGSPATAWTVAVVALVFAAFFAILRESLEQCSPTHVLEQLKGKNQDTRRAALQKLLERSERMTTCASTLEILFAIGFIVYLLIAVGFDASTESFHSTAVITAGILTVPILLLATRILPPAFDRSRGDALLASLLPGFSLLETLLLPIIWPLDLMRKMTLRLFGLREENATTRILVEDLREVIEDSDRDRSLPDSGLELIENVMEFHDVDVAAVMTPRTDLSAIDVSASSEQLIHAIAECGHSRLGVFEESLDAIIGWVTARDVIRLLDRGELSELQLREKLRPPQFVPETKLIADMLRDFQSGGYKLAFVLDEYGGTAGIVTLGDVLEELVGEMRDENDEAEEATIQQHPDGIFSVVASEHVSEVNAVIGIKIPEEEDYETLAGFMLGHFGRFPREGESFAALGAEFTVLEASDRRVLRVSVRALDAPSSDAQ